MVWRKGGVRDGERKEGREEGKDGKIEIDRTETDRDRDNSQKQFFFFFCGN